MNNQVHFPLSTKLTGASQQNGVPLSNWGRWGLLLKTKKKKAATMKPHKVAPHSLSNVTQISEKP